MRLFLLALLASFLTLGADPPADPPDDPPADDPPADPPDDDLPNLDEEDDPPADPPDDDDPAVIRAQLAAERKARETAERNHREATDRLAAAERARAQPAAPSADQTLFEQEEARLKASDCTPLEKWQIESNRAIRAQTRTAQQALAESREIADKAEFASLAAARPGLMKKYGDRVEKKLADIRAQGGNLARKTVLKMMLGDDIVEGNVKTTKRTTTGAAAPVNRGKPPAARSDVRGRGGQSEHDKRRARLENQIL